MNAIVEDYKWGGLSRRYKFHHGGAYRAIDPVDGGRVSFGRPVLFDNWLLRRFDPSIDEIVIRPSIISGPPGHAINETPDLDIYFVDGHREFDQVTGTKLDDVRAIRLRKLPERMSSASTASQTASTRITAATRVSSSRTQRVRPSARPP